MAKRKINKNKKRRIKNIAIMEASENGYIALPDGNIKSPFGKILKPYEVMGYLCFSYVLKNNRKRSIQVSIQVHRFVAYTKYGDKIFKFNQVVRHLNGNSKDNSFENIAIGTRSDNERDKSEEVRNRVLGNLKEKNRTLTEEQVKEIRQKRKEGITLKKLAELYNSSITTIHKIVKKLSYKEI